MGDDGGPPGHSFTVQGWNKPQVRAGLADLGEARRVIDERLDAPGDLERDLRAERPSEVLDEFRGGRFPRAPRATATSSSLGPTRNASAAAHATAASAPRPSAA